MPELPLTHKRPLAVTVVGWLLTATGLIELAFHLAQVKPQQRFQSDIFWMVVVGLAAIVGGIATLQGRNWGRWLALAWIGFHVILSFFHSWQQVAVHALIFVLLAYLLFRSESAAFFRARASHADG